MAVVASLLGSTVPALAGGVTAEEEQFVYELNQARRDPAAYAAANLSGQAATIVANFTPMAPLAVNDTLSNAAQLRSDDMFKYQYFAHWNPTTGFGPDDALAQAGYSWTSWGENIGLRYTNARQMLNGFLNSNAGHRESVMGQGTTPAKFREIGVGTRLSTGDPDWYGIWTASLAKPTGWVPALTGVVYEDKNNNGRMELGEGLPGVTVKAGSKTATSNAGGGWTLKTGSGSFSVTATGGGMPSPLSTTKTVGSNNVWVEFISEDLPVEQGKPPCKSGDCDSLALVGYGGKWHLWEELSADASTNAFYYGNPGDIAFMGDWDGDGVATPGLYRQSDGYVYLRHSNTEGVADVTFFFGNPGDYPLVGDFNGDGKDTVSIYRASEAKVYVINALGKNGGGLGAADFSFYFGRPGDKPFVGDFNGNGQDTIGLHRRSTGFVYFRNSLTQGNADLSFFYGDPGDVILAGDWDGDGDDTVAVYRPSTGRIYVNLKNSSGVADYSLYVGSYPVAATYGSK
jgi:uncharacterized protein YkwD